jgi:site-specific DNA-methyltransferase (adenine-specific)
MNTDVMFSSKTDEWATPQEFFDTLNDEFHFTLDVCATEENAKCDKYYTRQNDGLAQNWSGEVVWCNPPYGREMPNWIKKCAEHADAGGAAVMLIPARTDTKAFHEYIYGKAEIRFVRGRLKFGNAKNTAPFPSMVVIFDGRSKETL